MKKFRVEKRVVEVTARELAKYDSVFDYYNSLCDLDTDLLADFDTLAEARKYYDEYQIASVKKIGVCNSYELILLKELSKFDNEGNEIEIDTDIASFGEYNEDILASKESKDN